MEGTESFKLRTLFRERLSKAHALDTAMAREREGAEEAYDWRTWGPRVCNSVVGVP